MDGTPQRSEGRLSVSQLAVEADVKRWHLTHQHTDVKDLFQARAQQSRTGLAAKARAASAYEELKIKQPSSSGTAQLWRTGRSFTRPRSTP